MGIGDTADIDFVRWSHCPCLYQLEAEVEIDISTDG